MGYYTEIVVDVRVKKEMIRKFKAEIRRKTQLLKRDNDWFKHWFSYYSDISVNKGREITFEEYLRKMFSVEEFAEWLAKFVEEGYIYGYGEVPEDVWRIYFDGKGNYCIQVATFVWSRKA